MQVRELIARLQRVDPDAHVVVAGEIVHGIELRLGRIETGYYNPVFIPGKGKDTALVFLANSELSTGEVVSVPR
jgi:hypothetical protein